MLFQCGGIVALLQFVPGTYTTCSPPSGSEKIINSASQLTKVYKPIVLRALEEIVYILPTETLQARKVFSQQIDV